MTIFGHSPNKEADAQAGDETAVREAMEEKVEAPAAALPGGSSAQVSQGTQTEDAEQPESMSEGGAPKTAPEGEEGPAGDPAGAPSSGLELALLDGPGASRTLEKLASPIAIFWVSESLCRW